MEIEFGFSLESFFTDLLVFLEFSDASFSISLIYIRSLAQPRLEVLPREKVGIWIPKQNVT